MNIQPTEDRIYILPDKKPDAPSMGGIGSANFGGSPIGPICEDRPNTGRIVACGPGKMHPDYKGETSQPMPYRKGQRVVFVGWSGDKVVIGSRTYYVVRARDVTAVIGGPSLKSRKA